MNVYLFTGIKAHKSCYRNKNNKTKWDEKKKSYEIMPQISYFIGSVD